MLRNNVAFTSNHCCNGNASLLYVCIVEVHVTVSNITILCAAKNAFMAKLRHRQQQKAIRSSRKVSDIFV